jgi:hypothetical protein
VVALARPAGEGYADPVPVPVPPPVPVPVPPFAPPGRPPKPPRPPNPPAVQEPFTGAEIVTLFAVTVPTLSVEPAAFTHEPTARTSAVALVVWVKVVVLASVTFTDFVLAFGLAFFFVGGWNTMPFTTTLSPDTLVTLPLIVPKLVAKPGRVPPLPVPPPGVAFPLPVPPPFVEPLPRPSGA